MISERCRALFSWTRLWRLKGSAKSTRCLDSDSDSDDEPVGSSATADKQTETMQNSLSIPDRRVLPGSHEKSKVCRFNGKIHHQRKRIKMFIKRVAERGGMGIRKEILVTTRIEVVSTPVPTPTSQHVTFYDHLTVTSMDFASYDSPASPRSVSRLMMSPLPSYTVDTEAGAERGNARRHSLPFTSSRAFQKLTNVASKSRVSNQNDGSTSVLGMEAEWTQCLERATMKFSTSCGTLESTEEETVDGKRRISWRAGRKHLGRLGIGRRIRRMEKVG